MEILKKLGTWGKLTLVSDFSAADLVMEVERLDALRAFSEFRDSEGGGTAFAAKVRHGRSGVAVWSTSKGASWPMSDPTGAWAGRAIADEFTSYFDKILAQAAPSQGPQGPHITRGFRDGRR